MKFLAAVAVVAGLGFATAWAQHGSSHGGSVSHSGSAGHMGAGGHSAPMSRSGVTGYPTPMSHPAPVGPTGDLPHTYLAGQVRSGAPNQYAQRRMPYDGSAHGRRGAGGGYGERDRYRQAYWRGYPTLEYGYLGWPGYPFLWNDAGYYGDSADYNGSTSDAAYAGSSQELGYGDAGPPFQQGYGYPSGPAPYNYGSDGYPPAGSELESARGPYDGQRDEVNPPAPVQAVTVVFKDGRPSEQIHNYLLTTTTLTVLDDKYRQIPLDQINLAATEATNRADGVDFRVPQRSR